MGVNGYVPDSYRTDILRRESALYKPKLIAWMEVELYVLGMAVVEPSVFEAELVSCLRKVQRYDAAMAGESGAIPLNFC